MEQKTAKQLSEERKAEQVRGRMAVKNLYRKVFLGTSSAAEGREVLADILMHCKLVKQSNVFGDPERTTFNAGLREVGINILDALDVREFTDLSEMTKKHKVKIIDFGD